MGYPIYFELGKKLQKDQIPNGKFGACLLAAMSLNALVLACTMILYVSNSLLWIIGNLNIHH